MAVLELRLEVGAEERRPALLEPLAASALIQREFLEIVCWTLVPRDMESHCLLPF